MKIFYHGTMSDNLRHLTSLAKCQGVDADCIRLTGFDSLLLAFSVQGQGGVVLDVASFEGQFDQDQLECLAVQIANHDLPVLLLATRGNDATNLILQVLSAGAVRAAKQKIEATRVCFPADANHLVGELASFSYPRSKHPALRLVIDSPTSVDVLMNLDDVPSFVKARKGRGNLFVWSTDKVFDVHRPLAAEKEFEEAADQYVPAIIFIRYAFGDQCWHNPSPGAGIVIDDPLLKRKYGFINFPRLLESARTHTYHVTLAFIPWNHWRTRVKEARMFVNYPDCFSVCAHGCDHIKREFRSNDYENLLNRNFVARRRMEQHRERTGLQSEPLMVCPQEEYSLEAMRAFADSRQFMGLVCTACMPRDLKSPCLCGADLLLPAQDLFFGFPVFKRHYWKDLSPFAMGLFLGKPAILVEHHEFFRNGPAGAEAFVSGLSRLRPDLRWTSLTETATGTHLVRRMEEGRFEVRFFTDVFNLNHEYRTPVEYHLVRRIPTTTPVRRVLVNGQERSFVHKRGSLTFEIRADGPQTFRIQIEVYPIQPKRAYARGIKYQASVVFRRGLSEFRDNVIARNNFVLRAARSLAKTMKQTSN